jgi:glucosamine 6-phosphate synthetase-like amidotransferase/phosphosugar isomerase protein
MTFMMKFNRLAIAFKQLQYILERESENNWLKGIKTINNQFESSITEAEKENTIKDVSQTFKMISAGYGSFSDYYIWRDDVEERIKLNNELSLLIEEIWYLIK